MEIAQEKVEKKNEGEKIGTRTPDNEEFQTENAKERKRSLFNCTSLRKIKKNDNKGILRSPSPKSPEEKKHKIMDENKDNV